jgi:hypothetical protein
MSDESGTAGSQGDTMINANPLKTLGMFGQSIWLDYIRRDLITSG